MTPTAMIRQFASVHTVVRRRQVREQLGLSAEEAGRGIDNLVKNGWLRRTGHGIYEFVNRPLENDRQAPIRDRLWRAMRINPRFSATEIARQAGTTRNYANKVLRQYLRAGMVRRQGQQCTTTGSHETVWMMTGKGKKNIQRPTVEKWQPDPLVVKAVQINKLVCTGAVGNNPEDAAKAARLCRELAEEIEGKVADGS